MTTAYFLKMRTTKKACHRTSFQTARVRRMMRRKHRGELAPHTRNTYLPRNSPYYKEMPSCQLYGMIKEYRQYYPCIFALYHIIAALSREIRTFFTLFCLRIFLLFFPRRLFGDSAKQFLCSSKQSRKCISIDGVEILCYNSYK